MRSVLSHLLRREAIVLLALVLPGCRCNDMRSQNRHNPLDPSPLFEDQRSARPTVPGSVPWGRTALARDDSFQQKDELLYTGRMDGKIANLMPFPVTSELLDRGRSQFTIYCSVCHGRLGNGDGMIVRRGFPRPPSYHEQRLRDAPLGHFFDVMTNGFGAMYSYSDRLSVEDRWAIVAYIRALQRSQNARPEDVPPGQSTASEPGGGR